MTSGEVKESFSEIRDLFKETDLKFKETDLKFKETDVKFKQTEQRINDLANLFTGQWGKLIESLAESGIVELLQQRGIKINKLSRRIVARRNGHHMEIDFLITNTKELVVGEVKTRLKVADVTEFLDKLNEFPVFFPEYKGYKVYGAVIGIQMDEGADRFAYQHGLFVFKVGSKDTMTILNDERFRPVDFGVTSKNDTE